MCASPINPPRLVGESPLFLDSLQSLIMTFGGLTLDKEIEINSIIREYFLYSNYNSTIPTFDGGKSEEGVSGGRAVGLTPKIKFAIVNPCAPTIPNTYTDCSRMFEKGKTGFFC